MTLPKIIKLKKFNDERGFFKNIFDKKIIKNLKISKDIKDYQISISYNKKRVLRGLHYQVPMQNKFVYLLEGKIQDVIVNIDRKSKNFGKCYEFILNDNTDILFIPKNYAHGFCALENSKIIYILDKNYNQRNEHTINWKDKRLDIKWKYTNPIVSNKDKMGKSFSEL